MNANETKAARKLINQITGLKAKWSVFGELIAYNETVAAHASDILGNGFYLTVARPTRATYWKENTYRIDSSGKLKHLESRLYDPDGNGGLSDRPC